MPSITTPIVSTVGPNSILFRLSQSSNAKDKLFAFLHPIVAETRLEHPANTPIESSVIDDGTTIFSNLLFSNASYSNVVTDVGISNFLIAVPANAWLLIAVGFPVISTVSKDSQL